MFCCSLRNEQHNPHVYLPQQVLLPSDVCDQHANQLEEGAFVDIFSRNVFIKVSLVAFGNVTDCAGLDKSIFQVEIIDRLINVSSRRFFQTFLLILESKCINSGPVFLLQK
jgi:hypothetical protein